jgi:purine-binding chemotaxis protein CheW
MESVKEKSGQSLRYIQFSLGQEIYAIPLLDVKEVIPIPETTKLPNAPKHFVGIMNLRGQIISVVDLRIKLNIPKTEAPTEEAVIIASLLGLNVGLVVDSINKVLTLNRSDINEVPEVNFQVSSKYLLGVYQGSENLTIMLDLEQVLDVKAMQKLTTKAA